MVGAKIAVLVSGGGTNLQALIDAQKSGIIKSGNIELVVSKEDAERALSILKANGEDAYIIGEVVKGDEGVILW